MHIRRCNARGLLRRRALISNDAKNLFPRSSPDSFIHPLIHSSSLSLSHTHTTPIVWAQAATPVDWTAKTNDNRTSLDIARHTQRAAQLMRGARNITAILQRGTWSMRNFPARYGEVYGAGGALFEPTHPGAGRKWEAVAQTQLGLCALSLAMMEVTRETTPCIFCGSVGAGMGVWATGAVVCFCYAALLGRFTCRPALLAVVGLL